jgi:hypothetical protein
MSFDALFLRYAIGAVTVPTAIYGPRKRTGYSLRSKRQRQAGERRR